MATLKIGTTPSNYVTMPNPDQDPFSLDFDFYLKEKQSVQNDRNISYTGRQKKIIMFRFKFRSLTDLNSILAYANTSYAFFVQIQTATGTYYEALSYILLKKTTVLAVSDDFKHSFELTINEI